MIGNNQINIDEQLTILLSKTKEDKSSPFRIGITSSSYDSITKTVSVKFNSADPSTSAVPCKCTYGAQRGFADFGSSPGKTTFVIKVGSSWVVTDLF